MTNDQFFNDMLLPKDNPNENLETNSKNKLLSLFDVNRFEVRSEDLRDKGIDLHIELKKERLYTNLRFAVQLKATDKPLLEDGTIKWQLPTSNINYLMNNGMPAYYILYSQSSDTFYYENLNDFIKTLYHKDAEWFTQASHQIVFSKPLTAAVIDLIYQETLAKGILLRQINEKLILDSASFPSSNHILIQPDLSVVDDAEIRKLIEGIGFTMINEGRWQEVIAVHRKGSQGIATTARYNLILGIACYYNGHLLEGLVYLKKSFSLQKELPKDLVDHLAYYNASIKHALGFIEEEEYQQSIRELASAQNVGLYIQLDKAKENYFKEAGVNSELRFIRFQEEVNQIIQHPQANIGIQLLAQSEMIFIQGAKNNWDYVHHIALINASEHFAGPNQPLRAAAAKDFVLSNIEWFKQAEAAKKLAMDNKLYFYFYHTVVNEVKVVYEMQVLTNEINLMESGTHEDRAAQQAHQEYFPLLMSKLNKALAYFKDIGHVENQIVTLCLQFELYHYVQNEGAATAAMQDADNLVTTYELTEKKRRLIYLKNKGTTHERIRKLFADTASDIQTKFSQVDKLIKEIQKIDEKEKQENHIQQELVISDSIELIPLGLFRFPETARQVLYSILHIESEAARLSFDYMYSNKVIPVANIFWPIIEHEGPLQGYAEDKGLISWENILEIRRALYEHKFFRHG